MKYEITYVLFWHWKEMIETSLRWLRSHLCWKYILWPFRKAKRSKYVSLFYDNWFKVYLACTRSISYNIVRRLCLTQKFRYFLRYLNKNYPIQTSSHETCQNWTLSHPTNTRKHSHTIKKLLYFLLTFAYWGWNCVVSY